MLQSVKKTSFFVLILSSFLGCTLHAMNKKHKEKIVQTCKHLIPHTQKLINQTENTIKECLKIASKIEQLNKADLCTQEAYLQAMKIIDKYKDAYSLGQAFDIVKNLENIKTKREQEAEISITLEELIVTLMMKKNDWEQKIKNIQQVEKKFKEKYNCPICINEINDDSKIKQLACNHKFHKKCIERWILRSKTCPICRKIAETKQEKEKREKLEKEKREEVERKIKLAIRTQGLIAKWAAHPNDLQDKTIIPASEAIHNLMELGILDSTYFRISKLEHLCLNINIHSLRAKIILGRVKNENSIAKYINRISENHQGRMELQGTSFYGMGVFYSLLRKGKNKEIPWLAPLQTYEKDIRKFITEKLLELNSEIDKFLENDNDHLEQEQALQINIGLIKLTPGNDILTKLIRFGVVKKEDQEYNEESKFGKSKIIIGNESVPFSFYLQHVEPTYTHGYVNISGTTKQTIKKVKEHKLIQKYIDDVRNNKIRNSANIHVNKIHDFFN